MNEISEKDVKRLWVEKDVNSSEITNRCEVAGRLYTWAAAMDSVKTGCGYGVNCSPTLPVQGICPRGWHLPDSTKFWTAT